MRHFGFEFDRCMDVVSAKACLFGADDVLEHRESLFGFAGLNEDRGLSGARTMESGNAAAGIAPSLSIQRQPALTSQLLEP